MERKRNQATICSIIILKKVTVAAAAHTSYQAQSPQPDFSSVGVCIWAWPNHSRSEACTARRWLWRDVPPPRGSCPRFPWKSLSHSHQWTSWMRKPRNGSGSRPVLHFTPKSKIWMTPFVMCRINQNRKSDQLQISITDRCLGTLLGNERNTKHQRSKQSDNTNRSKKKQQ